MAWHIDLSDMHTALGLIVLLLVLFPVVQGLMTEMIMHRVRW